MIENTVIGITMLSRSDKSKVFLTQNSELFSLMAALQLWKADRAQSEKIAVILDEFWLDNIDESHRDMKWGQTIAEFPLFVQAMINKLFPGYPRTERITMGMFQKIRQELIIQLQAQGVAVIKSEVHQIKREDNQLHFEKKMKDGIERIFTTDSDCEIYNALQMSRPLAIRDADNHAISQYNVLFNHKKGTALPSPVLIFGAGLSALWMSSLYPKNRFMFITSDAGRPAEIARTEGMTLPPVVEYKDTVPFAVGILTETQQLQVKDWLTQASIAIPPEDELRNWMAVFECQHVDEKIMHAPKGKYEEALYPRLGSLLFVGKPYAAAGFTPKFILHEGVMIHNIHAASNKKSYSPKNLPPGALMDRMTDQLSEYFKDEPINTRILHVQFGSLFFRETDFEVIEAYMIQQGIDPKAINPFFENLKKQVVKREDAISVSESIDFMVAVFSEASSPGKVEQHRFRKILSDLILKQEALVRSERTLSNKVVPALTQQFEAFKKQKPDDHQEHPHSTQRPML